MLSKRALLRTLRLPFALAIAVAVVTFFAYALLGLSPVFSVLLALGTLGIVAAILLSLVQVCFALYQSLQSEVREQVGGLSVLFPGRNLGVLWPLGGWALSPAAAGSLGVLISRDRPKSIVELGAGSSTILLAEFLSRTGLVVDQWLSVEHDSDFAQMLSRTLAGEYVDVIHAPIRSAESGPWYDTRALDAALKEPVDLLIVDGPPGSLGRGIRGNALPYFFDRLSDYATILVDDTNRSQEREMVDRWLHEFPGLSVAVGGLDHTVLVFRRGG